MGQSDNIYILNRQNIERHFSDNAELTIDNHQGGISSSVLSVFFTDKFALSQSDARISVAYKICQ